MSQKIAGTNATGIDMIDFEKGLYITIKQFERGPHPMPLTSGFSEDVAYRVLAIYNPSESGECWLVLSNDRDEMWFISQRHVRTFVLDAQRRDFRFDVAQYFLDMPDVAPIRSVELA
ncbi:MAG: hypothetical protein WBP11_10805 [Dokdonella sp.]